MVETPPVPLTYGLFMLSLLGFCGDPLLFRWPISWCWPLGLVWTLWYCWLVLAWGWWSCCYSAGLPYPSRFCCWWSLYSMLWCWLFWSWDIRFCLCYCWLFLLESVDSGLLPFLACLFYWPAYSWRLFPCLGEFAWLFEYIISIFIWLYFQFELLIKSQI